MMKTSAGTEKLLGAIEEKVFSSERISAKEALVLYNEASPAFLGKLANHVREKKNGNKVFFNRNIHIEPTNICVHKCRFCSFKSGPGNKSGWAFTIDEISDNLQKKLNAEITEIHITGGVHPDRDIHWYLLLLNRLKDTILPHVHIKAFTAIEIQFMAQKSGISVTKALKLLKEAGLNSIPGGGAEILSDKIRVKLCPEKGPASLWINVHKKAHATGITSNATMLYGHIESYADRTEHLGKIRKIQDETHGFNAFIPLKFRRQNNYLSHLKELSLAEDLKNYAVSRIFLDNIEHIKAYWPMSGIENARLTLHFGADDFDGTINNSTQIYSMAGAEEKSPSLSSNELATLIIEEGFVPCERDSLYNIINNEFVHEGNNLSKQPF